MKWDQKKKNTEGKFKTRWGFKGLLRRYSTLQYTRTITVDQQISCKVTGQKCAAWPYIVAVFAPVTAARFSYSVTQNY